MGLDSPRPHSRHQGIETRNLSAETMSLIILIVLIVLLLGVVPAWPHSRGWGYGPSGGIGLLLVILLVLYFTGHRF